jgi:hypothetical protein
LERVFDRPDGDGQALPDVSLERELPALDRKEHPQRREPLRNRRRREGGLGAIGLFL